MVSSCGSWECRCSTQLGVDGPSIVPSRVSSAPLPLFAQRSSGDRQVQPVVAESYLISVAWKSEIAPRGTTASSTSCLAAFALRAAISATYSARSAWIAPCGVAEAMCGVRRSSDLNRTRC